MRKFQEKRNWRDVMQSKPMLVLLGIVLLALFWSVCGIFIRMQETAKNRKIEEDKITDLQNRKDKLSKDIANLKTEKGVEENIREKFGLVKEGEGMVVVVDDKTDLSTESKENTSGFFTFLKNVFK